MAIVNETRNGKKQDTEICMIINNKTIYMCILSILILKHPQRTGIHFVTGEETE
jgi:hypothetical protein